MAKFKRARHSDFERSASSYVLTDGKIQKSAQKVLINENEYVRVDLGRWSSIETIEVCVDGLAPSLSVPPRAFVQDYDPEGTGNHGHECKHFARDEVALYACEEYVCAGASLTSFHGQFVTIAGVNATNVTEIRALGKETRCTYSAITDKDGQFDIQIKDRSGVIAIKTEMHVGAYKEEVFPETTEILLDSMFEDASADEYRIFEEVPKSQPLAVLLVLRDVGGSNSSASAAVNANATSEAATGALATPQGASRKLLNWWGNYLYLEAGPNSYSGRLKQYDWQYGYGTVCDDYFDHNAARVACTRMGRGFDESRGAKLYTSASGPGGAGSGHIVLDDVRCEGTERNLVHCSHRRNHNCGHGEDVGLTCSEPHRNGDVRLVGRSSSVTASRYSGRLEYYHGGRWGTVCDDHFDDRDATVVCAQLGLGFNRGHGATWWGYVHPFTAGTGSIFLDDMGCTGTETRVDQCRNLGYGGTMASTVGRHNCGHHEDVAVRCSSPTRNIRLAGGSNQHEGRVEVYYNGQWGTVCDDAFDHNDAKVVCRSLGYYYGGSGTTWWGSGNGPGGRGDNAMPIYLDNLHCGGHESRLEQCWAGYGSHPGRMGRHNCGHSEDVAVRCSATPMHSPPPPSPQPPPSPPPSPPPPPAPLPLPSSWTCPAAQFDANDGCHCGCGAVDADCLKSPTQQLFGCSAGSVCNDDGECRANPTSGVRVGATVALYNRAQRRYVRIVASTRSLAATDIQLMGYESVPSRSLTARERFVVVDGEDGTIGLHSALENGYVEAQAFGAPRMHPGQHDSSAVPSDWTSAMFRAIDAGNGEFALYSHNVSRFIRMHSNATMGFSSAHEDNDALSSVVSDEDRFVFVDLIPSEAFWGWSQEQFNRNDGCHCGRGSNVLDPDCLKFPIQAVHGCVDDQLCFADATCGDAPTPVIPNVAQLAARLRVSSICETGRRSRFGARRITGISALDATVT